jgi:hypothetical protein
MLLLNVGNFAGGTLSGYWFHRIWHNEAFAQDTPEREHKVRSRFYLKFPCTKDSIRSLKKEDASAKTSSPSLLRGNCVRILNPADIFFPLYCFHILFFFSWSGIVCPLGGILSLDITWMKLQKCSFEHHLSSYPKIDVFVFISVAVLFIFQWSES